MQLLSIASLVAACAMLSGYACANERITVGVRGGMPLAMVEPGGSMSGLYVEVLEAIAGQAQAPIGIQALPLPRMRQYLKDGKVTAVLAIADADMLEDAVTAGEVMQLDIIALGQRGSQVQSIEQLRGKRICLSRGSSLVPELYDDKRYLLTEVSEHISCPKLLDAGRVDFVVSIRIGLLHLLAQLGKGLSHYGEPYVIKRVPVHLLVARAHSSTSLMKTLRIAVRKAKRDGSIDAIRQKYDTAAPELAGLHKPAP